MGRFLLLTCNLILAPLWLMAQTNSTDRTVTVTSSRTSTIAPDLGVIYVDVYSKTDASLDEVLAALQGSGVTAANFNSVYTSNQLIQNGPNQVSRQSLDWSFMMTVPLANLKTNITSLTALQATVAQKNNGLSVSFALRGTQTSPQALAGQNCGATELMADARAQAQKLAAGAGLSVGAVVSVSGTSVVTPATGGFSSGTVQPSCTLTVKFALAGV